MKIFTLVLALTLLSISFAQEEVPIVGGWTDIDPTTIKNRPEVRAALFFGAQFVSEQANAVGALNSNWSLSKVHDDAASQVVAGLNYHFNVTIVDPNGLSIDAQFNVWVVSWQNHTEVTSYSYEYGTAPEKEIDWVDNNGEYEYSIEYSNIPEGEEDDLIGGWLSIEDVYALGGYQAVNVETALAQEDTQNALNVGIEKIGTQGVSFGFLQPGNWTLVKVNDIAEQKVDGTWYQFQAELTNGIQHAWAYFIVVSDPANNSTEVSEWGIQNVESI